MTAELIKLIVALLILNPDLTSVNQIESKSDTEDFCSTFFDEDRHFRIAQRNETHYILYNEKYYYWLNVSAKEYPLKRYGISADHWLTPDFTPVADHIMCCQFNQFKYEPTQVSMSYNKEKVVAKLKVFVDNSGRLIEKQFEKSPEQSCVLYKGICVKSTYDSIFNNNKNKKQESELQAIIQNKYEKLSPRTVNGNQEFKMEKPIMFNGARVEYLHIIVNENAVCLDQKCKTTKELAQCNTIKTKVEPTPDPLPPVILNPNQDQTEDFQKDSQFTKNIQISYVVGFFIGLTVLIGFLSLKGYEIWHKEENPHNNGAEIALLHFQ